jgi:hypothetical protein
MLIVILIELILFLLCIMCFYSNDLIDLTLIFNSKNISRSLNLYKTIKLSVNNYEFLDAKCSIIINKLLYYYELCIGYINRLIYAILPPPIKKLLYGYKNPNNK